jgi:hypothetical protein
MGVIGKAAGRSYSRALLRYESGTSRHLIGRVLDHELRLVGRALA